MVWSFILTILLVLIFTWYMQKKCQKNATVKFLMTMGVGIIAILILVFPLLENNNALIRFTNSFYYAIKSITLNEDIGVLSKINIGEVFGFVYFLFINLFLIALPVLTVSALLSILSNFFTDMKFRRLKNKDLYVFSEMNEKSLLIAEDVKKRNNSAIIFAKVEDEDKKTSGSPDIVKLSQKVTEMKLSKMKNEIKIYMISENEEENLTDTLELIDKYKDKKMMIYVINNSEEASAILESTDKGEVTVELVNETERAIFNLLDKNPLYLKAINNTISVLIVGCRRSR